MMNHNFYRAAAYAVLLAQIVAMPSDRVVAAVPGLITFQGRLTNTAGIPVPDGPYLVRFQIYDVPAGGSPLWNPGYQNIQVTDGVYSYLLGQDVPFPDGLFTGGYRWLGITVGVDPELTPRKQIVATGYAFVSQNADSVNWSGIRGIPAGFADGVDDNSGGDITAVNTSVGLTGGATSGDANLSIASGGVISSHIQDGTIVDADIAGSANISPSKIAGGVATLPGTQSFSGTNTFNNTIIVGDSTARLDNSTVAVGRITAAPSALLSARRNYANASFNYGLYSWLQNSSTGQLTALYGLSRASTPGAGNGGVVQGVYARAESDGSARYGVYAIARTLSGASAQLTGYTYGLYASASNGEFVHGLFADADSSSYIAIGVRGRAQRALGHGYGISGIASANGGVGYGVYGESVGNAVANWAGYFIGDVNVSGTIIMPVKYTEIDHPLDPENQTLRLAGVDSPQRKVIYDGIVSTGADGEAVVTMPPYFDALNTEFRYQLTVIGDFAQAIVLRKLDHGQFTIKTDKPHLDVSWQVTGIRKDAFATANPTQVEMSKRPEERGRYLHPEAFGLPRERGVNELRHGHARQISPEKSEIPEPLEIR